MKSNPNNNDKTQNDQDFLADLENLVSSSSSDSKGNASQEEATTKFSAEELEKRVLYSATWIDADTAESLEDGTDGNDVFFGTSGNDQALGGGGNDLFVGFEGNDALFGGDGDDMFLEGEGDDLLVGGAGEDSAVFQGNRADYTVTMNEDGSVTVADKTGQYGTDTLLGIETLEFADQSLDYTAIATQNSRFESSFEDVNSSVGFAIASDGWSPGSGEMVEMWDDSYVAGEAVDGENFIELNDAMYYPDSSSIHRDIDTEGSAQYELEFQYSSRPGFESYSDFAVKVIDNATGETLATETFSNHSPISQLTWNQESISFEGTGNSVRLEFESTAATHYYGRGVFLDDIQLTETTYADGGADDATSGFDAAVQGVEDSPISLGLDSLVDSNDFGSVNIANLPSGATLSVGVDNGDGTWTVQAADFASVELNPPQNFNGDIQLTYFTQSGTDTQAGEIQVEVAAVNDAPIDIDLSGNSVTENNSGVVVGTLSSTDLDSNGPFSYSVDDSRFEVVDGNLKLVDGVSLDHETTESITINVTSNDGDGGETTESFTINVNDVNEAATANAATATTAENTTFSGQLTGSDLDGDDLTYSVVSQPAAGSVTVNADGSYTFEPGSDFDDLAAGESETVTFTFQVDDGNGSTDTATVSIEVTGSNDGPTTVALSANELTENAAGVVVGTLATTDIDSNDTHSYTVDDSRFEVVDGNLKLVDGVSLDHEAADTITVTVTASDGNGGEKSESFTINVNDVNEAATANTASATTAENTTLNGQLTGSDLDGDELVYSVVSQPSAGAVTVNADGSYTFEPGADFDYLAAGESETVSFTFQVDDGRGSTDTATVEIEVTGTNDGPTAIALAGNEVTENAAGMIVGTLSTTDIDSSDTHTYSVDDSRFEIVDGNLKLVDGVSLDFEDASTLNVTVTSTDNSGTETTETFAINVNDVNEAATANSGAVTTAENATFNGQLTGSDLDGDDLTFTVVDQPSSGSVTVNSDGSYSFEPGSDFDYLATGETETVSFSFQVDDGRGSTDIATVQIEVTGTNDGPSAIALNGNEVTENAAGVIVGTLSTTDIDSNDTHSYSVDDWRFEVVDGNLKLIDGVALDHESADTITVNVTTTDNNGAERTEAFTINVNDVNEAATADAVSTTTSENATLGGLLTGSDLDGDDLTFTVVEQPSSGTINVSANGFYTFEPGSDFDYLAAGESETVSFTFQVDDGKGSTDTATVEIEVTGTNDGPSAVALEGNQVTENSAGVIVGTLSTVDADSSDTHSYSVDDSRFEVVDGNLKLVDGVTLDYEANDSIVVNVTTTDNNGAEKTEVFTVNVNDVNEMATANSVSTTTAENSTLHGQLTGSDLDGDELTYALVDQPSSGSVTVNSDGSYSFEPGTDFDYLAAGESETVSFSFQVDDGRGSTDTAVVEIEVTGTNDGPAVVNLTGSEVTENATGVVVGTLSTIDVDSSDTHSYSVDDARFEVVNGNLKLVDGVSLDYEAADTIVVNVTATDSSGAEKTESFTVNVNDVNEAATAHAESTTTTENQTLNGQLVGSDLDGDELTYSVVSQPTSGSVTVNADGSYTFEPGADFDHLAAGESETVSFTFQVDDGRGSTGTATVEIEVTGTNDGPSAVALAGNEVTENQSGVIVGTLSTSDSDSSDTHSYSVDDARFEVVDGNLKLVDGVSLDYEAAESITVTVTSTDNNGAEKSETFTIDVNDVNEMAIANSSSSTTSENSLLNGHLIAADLDGDDLTYTVVDQPSSGSVTVQANGGYSFDPGADFDYLAAGESETVSFTFQVDDGRGSTDTATVSIEVTGTNDGPTAVALAGNEVTENAAGVIVGTLSTTDIDSTDTHSYSVDDSRFEVVDGNLKLVDGVSLDHEAADSITVTVTSTDNNGAETNESFTINVNDINEAATADAATTTSDENTTLTGQLTGSDLDGDALTYTVVSQPSSGAVTVNADGTYTFEPGADFEYLAAGESETVSFTFQVDDGKGSTDTATVEIEVTGTNDGPTAVTLVGNDVTENVAGVIVGTLSTTDIDASDTHTYSVDDSRFEVVEGNLKLVDGVSLDHETADSITVTVTSTDNHGAETTESFTINVHDVNEAATADTLATTTSENATLTGQLTGSDLDGDDLSFSVVSQPSSGTVAVNADGSYTFEPGADFEYLAAGESETVSFTFQVDDGKGSTDTATVEIEVTGTNDGPTAIALAGNDVTENAVGVVVGTLSTTDIDSSNTHSYSVDDSRFEVVDGNLKLVDGVSLDHETADTITVVVTSTDNSGAETTESFTMNVNDVNEAATANALSTTTNENTSLTGQLTGSDLDGDELTYSVVTQPASGSVVVNSDGSYNFEPGSDFEYLAAGESETVSFTFQVDDGKGSTDTATVEIEVTGTNDGPTAIALSSNDVTENTTGMFVGVLSTSDLDSSDSHNYSVDDSRFEVVDGNLKLVDGVSLDNEIEETVTVTVTSTDNNGATTTESFTVNVNDVNEAATADAASTTTAENATLTGQLTGSDLDGDELTYSVVAQPTSGSVTVGVDGSYTFEPGSDFDYLAAGESETVSFTFQVDDGRGSTDTATVEIEVTGTNDGPTAVGLVGNDVTENEAGVVVGTLSTTDLDSSDTHSYTVDDSRFEVVDGNLKLVDGVSLDHELADSITVTVTSTDNNGAETIESFTINVNDVNEAATADAGSTTTAENATLTGQLTGSDLDGDGLTYNVVDQPTSGTVTINPNGSYTFEPGSDFDYLAAGESETVSFTFQVDDGRGSTDTAVVDIEVTGTNDGPSAIALAGNDVTENAVGVIVGTLSTTDVDSSDTHSYSVDDSRFEIVDGNLKLVDGVSLDHEAADTITVTVTSTDNNGATTNESFTINVNDVNEAATANAASATTAENATLSGQLTGTDLDGDELTYSVVAQPTSGVVTVDANGSYTFEPGSDFDYLAAGESETVSFTFQVDDGKGSTDTATVEIEVTGTNDGPNVVAIDGNDVTENSVGVVVGALSTVDLDSSDTHTYSVDDARFEVVDGNLKLVDGVSLDHELADTITVNVTSTDNNGAERIESIIINVNDVNEAATADAAWKTTAENATLIGQLTGSDLDGDELTYSVVTQPSSGAVTINANGLYAFEPRADFEHLAVGETETVSFTFQVDDGKGSTDTARVEIEVTGSNDGPTAIALIGNEVTENAAGVIVGTLSTTDLDSSDTHSYSVDDSRFEVVDGNLKLVDGVSLDYEAADSVTVTVTATDINGAETSEEFTINVNDVNEASTANADSTTTAENAVLTGQLTGSDLDGDELTYSVVSQPSSGSVVVNADGSYAFEPGSDFEYLAAGESETVAFTFQVDDGRGSTDTAVVEIAVTGTNDGPTAVALVGHEVTENETGVIVGTLSTSDIDSSDTHSYRVDDSRFEVVDGNLKLVDGVSLDYEDADTITVTVTSTDNNGSETTETFTIDVNDVNEAATADAASTTTAENANLTGQLTGSDLDGDALTYRVVEQPTSGSVIVNSDGSYSFEPGSDFDYLAAGESETVAFTFQVDDGRGSTDNAVVEIEVTGTNDGPTAVALAGNDVAENAVGVVVGSLSTEDLDSSDTHSYSVDDSRFEVIDGDLKLVDGVSLDYEAEDTITVNVTSTDNNGVERVESLIINVNDVNEAATANSATTSTSENMVLSGQLTGSDIDGDDLTYTLVAQPSSGSVTVNADGNYTFEPGSDFDYLAAGESETVTFTFQVDDGKGSTDTATVEIEVTGTNDGPAAIALAGTDVTENSAGVIVGTLSTTDSDSSDTHSYSVDDQRFEVVDGNLKLVDGVFLDYETETTISVNVTSTDNNGAEKTESFTINVNDVNEAATADAAAATTAENAILSGQLIGSDLDGDVLTYTVVDQPSSGSVTVQADGSYSFDPGSDFDYLPAGESETVSFTFQVDDGRGSTDTATVAIEVTGTNDGPAAVHLTGNHVAENQEGVVIGSLSTTDVDASDSHTYRVDDSRFEVVDGNLKLVDGVSLDHETTETITVNVTTTDNNGEEKTEAFTVHVDDVNEATTVQAGYFEFPEDDVLEGNVLANAFDVDGDEFEVVSYEQGSHGTVAIESDGSFLYAPDLNFSGSDSFSFTVQDEHGATTTQTVTVEVLPVADGAEIEVSNATSIASAPIPLNVSAELLDTDGSETIEKVVFGNVPEGTYLSKGVDNGDGTWTVQHEDLDGLTFSPTNQFGEIEISVDFVSSDGESEKIQSETITLNVVSVDLTEPDVAPAPTPVSTGPEVVEDVIETEPVNEDSREQPDNGSSIYRFESEFTISSEKSTVQEDVWDSSHWGGSNSDFESVHDFYSQDESIDEDSSESEEVESNSEKAAEDPFEAEAELLPNPDDLIIDDVKQFDSKDLNELEFQLYGLNTEGLDSAEEGSPHVAAESLLYFLFTKEDRRKIMSKFSMKQEKRKEKKTKL